MIRVELPYHLRNLARTGTEVTLAVGGEVTLRSTLDALEAAYPTLRGTVRDHVTGQRRPLLRFFAGECDLSHDSPDAPLPEAVQTGREPLLIVGVVAGGRVTSLRPRSSEVRRRGTPLCTFCDGTHNRDGQMCPSYVRHTFQAMA